MKPTRAYLTFNGRPYCDHTGCQAGQSLANVSGVYACSFVSLNATRKAAQMIRSHTAARVAVVAGECPNAPL